MPLRGKRVFRRHRLSNSASDWSIRSAARDLLSRTAPFSLLVPVVGLLAGWLALDESAPEGVPAPVETAAGDAGRRSAT